MPHLISLVLRPEQAADVELCRGIAARKAGVDPGNVASVRVLRRSIDARKKNPVINLSVEVFLKGEAVPAVEGFRARDVSKAQEVVIIGAGPAGLFAALTLIEKGLKPVILERGRGVSERKRDIAALNRGQGLDPESNYAYGEGGAGTFSDGKLYTRSHKRGDGRRALELFVCHGAPEEILYEAHPHIGSDLLPTIISNMRKSIVDCGGEIRFGAKVDGFLLRDGRILGVKCGDDTVEGTAVILATGHSAEDIYLALESAGIQLQAKSFALGVRVEHPQGLIDKIQYHAPERNPLLPAAAYSLVSQIGGRGVYSFCMCPGGIIVPAMTAPDELVVNGMSHSGRNSVWANSGIVTEIRVEDFGGEDALAGLRLRKRIEQAAALAGGGAQKAPAQRLTDFLTGRASASLPECSYRPGLTSVPLNQVLPKFVAQALRGGFRSFGGKMRGFLTEQAVVVGVESRTSSPVRIPRDPETLCHPQAEGLYPAAEGAGYAGGILSSAVDGQRIAEKIAMQIAEKL